MDMIEYEKKLKRMSFAELQKEKAVREAVIAEYEAGIPEDDPRWKLEEDPDVVYFHAMNALGLVYGYLSDAYLHQLAKKVLNESRAFNDNRKLKLYLDEEPAEESTAEE